MTEFFAFNHAFACQYRNTKMNFSKRFEVFQWHNDIFYNNHNQTWFSDALTSARPLGGLRKPSPFRLGYQNHQQMLVHRKTCLLPILLESAVTFGVALYLNQSPLNVGRSKHMYMCIVYFCLFFSSVVNLI